MTKERAVVVHADEVALESWNEATAEHVAWRTLFSADRTPTRGFTLGVAELPPREPGSPAVSHHHAQAEVYFLLEGEGAVFIDGEVHALRPGSAVYLPSGCEHVAVNTGPAPMRLLYVLAADAFGEVEYHHSPEPKHVD